MGSMYKTKSDQVCQKLEQEGYIEIPAKEGFTAYKKGSEILIVNSRGGVKKGNS